MTSLATIGFKSDVTGLTNAERSLDSLADEGERTERRLNSSTASSGNNFKKLAGTIGLAATALASFRIGSSAINSFKIFETGLVGVSKTTGLVGADLDIFSKKMKNLSLETPIATAELLELAQAAGQMGVTGAANLEKFAVTIAKLGRASDLSGEMAAKSLARILNVTGESIDSIDTLASVIVSLGNNSAATESEIARMTTEVARATSVFGVTSTQAAGLAAAMSSIGIQAELGGSSVGRTMQVLTDAIEGGKNKVDEFSLALGINSQELTKAFEVDKVKAFELVLEAVAAKGLGAGAALKSVGLGGQEIAKTIIPLSNNMGILNQTLSLANKELMNATALNKEYEATLDTLEGQQAQAINVMEAYAQTIGANLAPAFRDILSVFNEFGSTTDEIEQNVEAITNAFIASAGVIGGVVAVSYAKSTVATIANTIARNNGALAIAKNDKILAVSAAQRALQEKKLAGLALANTFTTTARVAAEKRLALSSGVLIAANSGVAASTLAVTAATRAASVSVALLTASTRILLGPFGLIITALGVGALAFMDTKDAAGELNDKIKTQKEKIEELTSVYKTFSKQRLGQESMKAQLRSIEIDLRQIEVKKELKALDGEDLFFTQKNGSATITAAGKAYDILKQEVVDLNNESDNLKITLKAVQKTFDDGLPKISDYKEITNELTDAQIEQNKVLALKLAAEKLSQESIQATSMALVDERLQLLLTSNEFELYQFKMKAIADGVQSDMIPALLAAKKVNQELRDSIAGDLVIDELTNAVENYGGAWSETGSVIIDAFGSMGDALGDYMKQVSELDKRERDIAKAKVNGSKNNIQITKLEKDLQLDRVKAELGGIKSLSAAGAELFSEKTVASKAFAAVNKAIAVAELAMMFTKMTVGTAEAGVHVANEGAKASSNAVSAITGAFAAPFPVNFIAGAAMIGIMASLVGGVSGGGESFDPTEDRQDSQGTGSLLGSDDKSNSIMNAQNNFEDIALDQLSELQGIKLSINNLSSGIEKLASSLVGGSGFGEFSGDLGGEGSSIVDALFGSIFGKTKKKLIDSGISFVAQSLGEIMDGGIVQAQAFFDIETNKKKLFGLISSVSTSTEFEGLGNGIQEQMGAIFNEIGSVVLNSAKTLGFETVSVISQAFDESFFNVGDFRFGAFNGFRNVFTEVEMGLDDALKSFNVDIGSISLEGLNGEEIQAELEAVFSQQADLIAQHLVPSIADFQKIGEGLFDTLTRVTKEQAIFNDAIADMGFNLSFLSSTMQIDISQSIITMIGGLDSFTSATNEFFNSFFSEQENLEILTKSLSDAFGSLGASMPNTREGFRDLIEGQDLTTKSGQRMFAMLMQLVPSMDEFFDALEEGQQKSLSSAMESINKAVDLEKDRAKEVMENSKDLFASEMRIIEAQRKAVIDQQKLAEAQLSETERSFRKSINLEKQRADAILVTAQQVLNSQLSMLALQSEALDSQNAALQATVDESKAMLVKSIDLEKERYSVILANAEGAFNAELSNIEKQRDLLNKQKESLENSVSFAEEMLDKSVSFEKERLNEILKNSEALFNDELKNIEAQKVALQKQKTLNDEVLSEAKSMLVKSTDIEKQRVNAIVGLAEEAFDLQINIINEQRKAIQDQSDFLTSNLKNAESMLVKATQLEKERLNVILNAADVGFKAETKRIADERSFLNEQQNLLKGNYQDAINMLKKSFSVENEAIKNSLSIKIDFIKTQANIETDIIKSLSDQRVDAMNDELSILKDRKSGLKSIISSMESLARTTQKAAGLGSNDIAGALSSARTGDFTQAQALTGGLPSSQTFGSAIDFKLAQETAKGQLATISELASGKAAATTIEVQAIEALGAQIETQIQAEKSNVSILVDAAKLATEQEIEAEKVLADIQLKALDEQLNTLLNIDTNILSLSESMLALEKTSQDIANQDFDSINLTLDQQLTNAQNLLELARSANAEQITALDNQINTLLNIDTSVLSLSDAITDLRLANANLNEFDFNLLSTGLNEQAAIAEQVLIDVRENANQQSLALDNQLNALLNIDTSVLTLPDAIEALAQANANIQSLGFDAANESLNVAVELAREQLEVAKVANEASIAALDQQLNTLLNIDTSILSLSDAIILLNEANSELETLNFEAVNNSLNRSIIIAEQELELAREANTQNLLALDNQLNTLLNIDTSIMTVADAILGFNAANEALESLNFDGVKASIDLSIELANEEFNIAQATRDNQLVKLDSQLIQILGLNQNISTLNEATQAYQDAQLQLDMLNTDKMLEQLSIAEDQAITALDLAELAYADEIARLDKIVETAEEQIAFLNTIEQNTYTTTQAIYNLADIIRSMDDQTANDNQLATLELQLIETSGLNENIVTLNDATTTFQDAQLAGTLGLNENITTLNESTITYQDAQLAGTSGLNENLNVLNENSTAFQNAQLAGTSGLNENLNTLNINSTTFQDAQLNGTFGLNENLNALNENTTAFQDAQLSISSGLNQNIITLNNGTQTYQNAQLIGTSGLNENLTILNDSTQAYQNAQLSESLGLNQNISTLHNATIGYQDAQLQLDILNTDKMLEQLVFAEDQAIAALDLAELAHNDEIVRLDLIAERAERQMEFLNGIQENTLTSTQALNNLALVIEDINQQPEPVITEIAKETIENEKIDKQRDLNNLFIKAVAKSSATTAKILQRIEIGGLTTRDFN